jgi:hypothetical protein
MQPKHTPPRLATTSSNWPIIGLTFFFFLLILRMLLPSIVLRITNSRLQEASPVFAFHVDAIQLKIMQGEYNLKGISGVYKDTGEPFLNIKGVSINLPWKEVFDQKFTTDLLIDRLNLVVSKKLVKESKQEQRRLAKESPKEEKESFIHLQNIRLLDSTVAIQDYMGLKNKDQNEILDINMNFVNATPVSTFNLSASVFGPTPFRVSGIAKLDKKPVEWDANLELLNFQLKNVNPVIQKNVKAFIHKGNLDLYSEVVSEEGKINGYVKPFITKLKIDTPEDGFEFKGEATKGIGNLLNALLKDSEEKTLATKISFTYDKKLDVDIIPALEKAIEHKITENIKPGIEDNVGQKGMRMDKDLKQAQEEK